MRKPTIHEKIIWDRLRRGGGSGGGYRTLTGDIIHFMASAAAPFRKLQIALEPIQDLHGYDSPWPAGGGKNLFYHQGDMTATANGVTATFNGTTQTITISGTNEAQSAYVLLSIPFTVDIPREVPLCRAFINAPTGTYINFAYRKNGVWVGLNNGEVLPTDADAGIAINIQLGVYGSATSFDSNNIKVEVERGSTAPTSYSPYSNICPISGRTSATVYHSGADTSDPTTYTIQLGQTVYGGTLDVTSGVLTVDRVKYTITADILSQRSYPSKEGNLWRVHFANQLYEANNNYKIGICNKYVFRGQYTEVNNNNNSIAFSVAQGNQIILRDDTLTTRDEVVESITNQSIECVYPLATPIEITLTPQTINSLVGENNVWDDGTVTVEVKGEAIT